MNLTKSGTDPLDAGGGRSGAPRVLVVDDVADNRVILARRLAPRGFEVVEAESGEAALALLEERSFDIVLLDIMMPGLGGAEVLRLIRQTRSELELPVIMVSAKSQSEDIVACLDGGANDYITKPVDLAVALARIRTQLIRRTALTGQEGAGDALTAHRLRYMAQHDGLTGLLNRTAFRERFAAMLAESPAGAGDVGLLFIDLDRFKAINDVHGHEAGDRLLGEVAWRLRQVAGRGALMARLGGDEFAVAVSGARPETLADWAEATVEALGRPFELDGQRFQVGVSCGAVHHSECGRDMDAMLKAADLAMYAAKNGGRSRAVRYEPRMLDEQRDRSALEIDFRAAMEDGLLEVHFQPLLDAATRRLVSFEALLRWPHPERGPIPPDMFVPVAERTGLIVPLGAWVLSRACAEAASWPAHLRVAVNLSPLQFRDGGLLPAVSGALAESGLAPERLELEITESALLDSEGRNFEILRALRAMGVRISVDDFGTGYSSMAYLQKFRFDKIKIDRRFVGQLGRHDESTAIVKAIIELGVHLGIDTTAEGVETGDQLTAVTEHGCTELQGFLFGRALDPEAVRAYIARTATPQG